MAVQTILTGLELVTAETKATVEVNDLPWIKGDRSQLEQLFQNLLSNALKFRRLDSKGVPVAPPIQISLASLAQADLPPGVRPAHQSASYYRINVADNSIGFDEQYRDRIFQVLQRLHGKNEFAGTGVGLAIVQKVVANHGGAITATSQPGQGASFRVYVPADEWGISTD